MEGFTGIKDLDKELMLNMGDREFIQTCQLNKYFQNICKDDFLFKRRIERFYPDTLKDEIHDKYGDMMSWKKYYVEVIKTVALLKEKYNFIYIYGNPFIQYKVLRTNEKYKMLPSYKSNILYFAILYQEVPLVAYAIKNNPKIITLTHLIDASGLYDITILKYMVEHGVDRNLLRMIDLSRVTYTAKEYLKYLGI